MISKNEINKDLNRLIATSLLVDKIEKKVKEKIIGQDNAIQKLTESFFKAYINPSVEKGPKAIILCVGPSGVGKTETIKIAAEALGLPVFSFDCSRYCNRNGDRANAFGTDKSYKEAQGGDITTPVDKKPASICHLDGFDEANYDFKTTIQTLFDTGYLFDNYEKKNVDFRNVIIVVTTNACNSLYNDYRVNYATLEPAQILDTLREAKDSTGNPNFPSSIISCFRKATIIPFNKLTSKNLFDIAILKAKNVSSNYFKEYRLKFSYDESNFVKCMLLKLGTTDARGLTSAIEHFLGEHFINVVKFIKEKKKNLNKLKEIKYVFDYDKAKDSAICFNNLHKPVIAIYCSEEERRLFENLRIETHFIKEEETITSLDYDAIIIGINSKSESKCIQLSKRFTTLNPDVPVYAFCVEGERSFKLKNRLTKEGIVEFFNESNTGFSNWLNSIIDLISFEKDVFKLKQKNQVLDFESHYNIEESKNNISVVVSIKDFSLKKVVSGDLQKRIVADHEIPNVRFTDIVGLKEIVDTLKELVEVFKDPIKAKREGKDIPKGVLFIGPSGCGKTLIAQAIAGESNIPMISRNPARDYRSTVYVGAAEEALKNDIKSAKSLSGILFLDEVDTIAKNRIVQRGVNSDVNNSLQNVLLTEMQGFSTSLKHPMFILAATNFPASELDPAFLERFDRIIEFKLPSTAERIEILNYYVNKHKINILNEDIQLIAERTIGESPRSLARLVRVVKNKYPIPSLKDFIEENEIHRHGEKIDVNSESMKKTAYHEAGHALSYYFTEGETPNYLTIVSRGAHGGYMELSNSIEKKDNYSYSEILNQIQTLLAGRAAEKVIYGVDGLTSGVKSDLECAKELAKKIINEFGMIEDFMGGVGQSEKSKQLFDDKVNEILNQQFKRAEALIKENQLVLEKLVELLLSANSLSKKDLKEFFENIKGE